MNWGIITMWAWIAVANNICVTSFIIAVLALPVNAQESFVLSNNARGVVLSSNTAGEYLFADPVLPLNMSVARTSHWGNLAEYYPSGIFQREPAGKRKRKRIRKFNVKKKRTVVPKARMTIKKIKKQILKVAEPPRQFRRFFEEGTDEAELESVINQEIKQLFNLLKHSKRRDLRLRLGSLYVEKARLIEYRLYEEYDRKIKLFNQRKIKRKPQLRLRTTYVYIDKAIKLFETYRRQYPKDRHLDQVLFFLGVSYFKRNRLKKGRDRYEALVKRFPKSTYVNDVNFELGEYYFNKFQWKKAGNYYRKIATRPQLKLYAFALYKLAWCQFNRRQVTRAMANLEKVIKEGFSQYDPQNAGVSEAGKLHFAKEALNDIPLFYSHSRKSPSRALAYFQRISGKQSQALKMLKELAYSYLDRGYLKGIRATFKQLVIEAPYSIQAYEYQYQIIRAYTYAGSQKVFSVELKNWLNKYGPRSEWSDRHGNDLSLLKKVGDLMESTVRNYTLRMHQSFRKTNDKKAKKRSLFGYKLYSQYFPQSKWSDQMRFFHGELLFDIKRYESAVKQYMYIVRNFKASKYYETAALNSVLAYEKTLPSSRRIQRLVKNKKTYVPFTRSVRNFEKVAHYYINNFPRKKNVPGILYKIASLHYEFNHYDKALSLFWNFVNKYPRDSHIEDSANLILDIYNIQKAFSKLKQAVHILLRNPIVAKSSSAREMRKILSQIALKAAENLARKKQYLASAREYKSFADNHPRSPLRMIAYYNSGVNFMKEGDILKAVSLYKIVLNTRSSKYKGLKKSILKELPEMYQKTGQYRKSAYSFFNFARSYPGESVSTDFWFNAALIYDGLNNFSRAKKAYLEYFKRSSKSDKTQALYLLAELTKRQGQASTAVSYYNQFLNRGSRNRKTLVESAFKIAEIKKAQGKTSQSRTWYKRTLNLYRKYGKGVFYAAQAQFNLVYKSYLDFDKIKIPANPKRQQTAVRKKLNKFNKLKEELKQVIRFDSGYQVVSSLVLIGLASEKMGNAIYYSPLPRGLNKKEIQIYKEGLAKAALPFKKEAIHNYELAMEKAHQLNAYNETWLKIAVEHLSTFNKSAVGQKPFLRKQVFPVSLIDWSGL